MLIRVIDFETTGLPPDAALVEVGWQDLHYDRAGGAAYLVEAPRSFLVNPGRPIPPEASAVHHILDADVVGATPPDAAYAEMMADADVFAAHNAAFERAFFAGGGKPWICTMKAARRVWPEAPGHGNQVLRYWRGLNVDRQAADPAHRAGPDALVTAYLLRDLILAGTPVEDMIAWADQPSLLPRVTFGKHRGKAWSDLPSDYLEWLAFKSEMDEDTKFTARHYLEKGAAR